MVSEERAASMQTFFLENRFLPKFLFSIIFVFSHWKEALRKFPCLLESCEANRNWFKSAASHVDDNVCSAQSKWNESCSILTLCNPMDYTGHGFLQARIWEWVVFSFSRGSSQPRDWTQVSSIAGAFFTNWAIREAPGIRASQLAGDDIPGELIAEKSKSCRWNNHLLCLFPPSSSPHHSLAIQYPDEQRMFQYKEYTDLRGGAKGSDYVNLCTDRKRSDSRSTCGYR